MANTSRSEDLPSSPYYMHPNENPSLVLTTCHLTGNNFHSWSRSMRMALISKNKIKFVDGTIPVPKKDDTGFSVWERCNTLVMSWLMRTLSPTIAQSVIWIDNARDIWDDLHERFTQGDAIRISDLQNEIYSLKQGTSSINDYFTHLRTIWDELSNLRPIPSCHCQSMCECGLIETIRKYHEQDLVIRFLKGLNENFAVIKSQILLMEPLPTINRAFALVVQQERETATGSSYVQPQVIESNVLYAGRGNFNQPNNSKPNNQGFNQNTQYAPRRYNNSSNKKPTCTYCGGYGHPVEKCFKKHGYPPGYKIPNRNFNGAVNQMDSNYSQQETGNSTNESYIHAEENESPMVLTKDQYNQLISLIQSSAQQPQGICNNTAMPGQQSHGQQSHGFYNNSHAIDNSPQVNTLSARFNNTEDSGHYQMEEDWYS
ncbi:uncharacterized protein LOC126682967 [Mercurialis annua]|uniref:uncharacterized protein LOC126682967 n=1 Tax=Mercurialis annua TaxID=3986 RepID=UPI00215EA9F2|nr:uncharacterized protein LOC126682967 [Mercurialis annua]